jgi:O-antigen ligase
MSYFQNKTFNIVKFLSNFILLLLPISFILGNAALNTSLTLFVIFFMISLILEKNFEILKNIYFKISLIFWLYLLFNSIFINFDEKSIIKSLGYVRFFLLPFAILYFFQVQLINKSIFFYIYSLIFFLVSLDILLQYFTGLNFLGFVPKMCVTVSESFYRELPHKFNIVNVIKHPYLSGQSLINCERFSGIFNNELIAGSYLLLFALPSMVFLMNFRKEIKYSKSIFFLILSIMLTSSLLTGDRTPVLIIILAIIIFFLLFKTNLKKKIYSFFFLILCFFITINFTPHLKHRFISWPTQILFSENKDLLFNEKKSKSLFKSFLFETQWGLHYLTAYDISKQNIFFGTGVKSFRNQCKKYDKDYLKLKYLKAGDYEIYNDRGPKSGCSTHPHNVYMELLAETGILGLSMFISLVFIFIFKIYKINKNENNLIFIFMLSMIVSMLFPFKPTGSYFSTLNAYLTWIIISFYFYWSKIKYIKPSNA